MKLELFYPVKPWRINQGWGVSNPSLYSQFGFTHHNGVDVAHGDDKLIRAPFDCKVVRTGFQPNGGGIFISFISKEKYTFDDGVTCQVLIDALHNSSNLLKEGTDAPVGTPLAIQGNTGLSTGPHTHFQFRRVNWDGINFSVIDKNEANGSFDPVPFWNKYYAKDSQTVITTLKTLANYLALLLAKMGK